MYQCEAPVYKWDIHSLKTLFDWETKTRKMTIKIPTRLEFVIVVWTYYCTVLHAVKD